MSKKVALKVNQTNLFNVLRNAFSSASVIGELMQNARRAGATWVAFSYDGSTLSVQDNGSGVADLQNLLTAAESGWNGQTQIDERPFGLGFLSALYSCKEIIVQSRIEGAAEGHTFRSTTEDLLSGGALNVDPVVMAEGTIIELKGFTLHSLEGITDASIRIRIFEGEVAKAAKGFAIHVHCNGRTMERPDALDEGFRETAVGHVRLNLKASDGKWYLQGLPIETRGFRSSGTTVVHLDRTFQAKIPDRQHLVDIEGSRSAIGKALRDLARTMLCEIKSTCTGETFLRLHARDCSQWGCKDLLDDIPLALGEWFINWAESSPGCHTEFEDMETLSGVRSKEDIEKGKVYHLAEEEFMLERCWQAVAGHYTLSGMGGTLLSNDHWLMKMARGVADAEEDGADSFEPAIELIVNQHIGMKAVDTWNCGNLFVAESLQLKHLPSGQVVEVEAAFDNYAIYFSRGAYPAAHVRLPSDYVGDDRHNEGAEAEAEAAFMAAHAEIIATDPAHLLTIMLKSGAIAKNPRLAGKSFTITFDDGGAMQAVTES